MSTRRGLIFSLAMVAAVAASSAAPPPARADTELKVCGEVAAYTPATALLPGALTVGATPFLVAAGTTLGSSVAVGANLCFDLTLGLGGGITGATVVANVSSTPSVCGSVTAFTAATTTATGALTINGVTFVIAVGAALPAVVSAGADLCLRLTLNGLGQVLGATAQANATSTLDICGVVDAYAAAGSTSAGTLTIAGQTFAIAAGTTMPASVNAGADLCMRLTLNGIGQVSAAVAQANLVSTIEVCGPVTTDPCGLPTVRTPEPDTVLLPGADAGSPAAVSDARARILLLAPIDTSVADALRNGPPGSGNVEPQPGQQNPSLGEGTAPDAAAPVDPGQILPDTASFGRAGKALIQVSLPLLLLLLGLLGREVVLRRRRTALAGQDTSGGAP